MFQKDYVPPDLKIIIELDQLIELYFKENLHSEFYSEKLDINIRVLNRYVKFYRCGKTVSDLLRERRYKEALTMIDHTCMSIKQISNEVGIFDNAYFSRIFKSMNGQSPSEYKKKSRFKTGSIL